MSPQTNPYMRFMSISAKPYYRYFKNIKQEVINVTNDWITGNNNIYPHTGSIWGIPIDAAIHRFNLLGVDLSLIYNIPHPTTQLGTREVYYIREERIEVPRNSIISFLHEYRHHMQKYDKQHYHDKEVDARGWSISLFAQAMPDAFDRAWREGRIWYLPPYSSNWRQEVGLT